MPIQIVNKEIFDTLNRIKLNVGLAVSDYLDNQTTKDKAIENMEIRFREIIGIIDTYFQVKAVLNHE